MRGYHHRCALLYSSGMGLSKSSEQSKLQVSLVWQSGWSWLVLTVFIHGLAYAHRTAASATACADAAASGR